MSAVNDKLKKALFVFAVICFSFDIISGIVIPLTTQVPHNEESTISSEILEEWNQNITYEDLMNLTDIFENIQNMEETNLETLKSNVVKEEDLYEHASKNENINKRWFVSLPGRYFKHGSHRPKTIRKTAKQWNILPYDNSDKDYLLAYSNDKRNYFRGVSYNENPFSSKVYKSDTRRNLPYPIQQKEVIDGDHSLKILKPLLYTVKYKQLNIQHPQKQHLKPKERSMQDEEIRSFDFSVKVNNNILASNNSEYNSMVKTSYQKDALIDANYKAKVEQNDPTNRKITQNSTFEFSELLKRPLVRPEITKQHIDARNYVMKPDKPHFYPSKGYKNKIFFENTNQIKPLYVMSPVSFISSIPNNYQNVRTNELFSTEKNEMISANSESDFSNPLLIQKVEEMQRLQDDSISQEDDMGMKNFKQTKTPDANNSNKQNSQSKCVYPECDIMFQELGSAEHSPDSSLDMENKLNNNNR